jgi:hypothetical protein
MLANSNIVAEYRRPHSGSQRSGCVSLFIGLIILCWCLEQRAKSTYTLCCFAIFRAGDSGAGVHAGAQRRELTTVLLPIFSGRVDRLSLSLQPAQGATSCPRCGHMPETCQTLNRDCCDASLGARLLRQRAPGSRPLHLNM